MSLRIEEHLHVLYVLARNFLQVGHGQIIKILLFCENVHALQVKRDKIIKAIETLIGFSYLGEVFKWLVFPVEKLDVVAFSQIPHHLRLHRSFEMKMHLNFWHSFDKLFKSLIHKKSSSDSV